MTTTSMVNHPILATLGEQLCAELSETHPPAQIEAEKAIARAGQPVEAVTILLEGVARVYQRAADGREVLLRLVEAPALFGDFELLQSLPHLADVQALGSVRVARLPAADYRRLLDEHPQMARAQLQHLAALCCLGMRGETVIFGSLEQRIANVLLAYADVFGEPTGRRGGVVVRHPLSQKSIARSVGAVWRSVGHVLAGLRRQGVLDKQGDYFVLKDIATLERAARPVRGGLNYAIGRKLDTLKGHSRRPPTAEIEVISGPESYCGQQVDVGEELLIGRVPPVDLPLPDEAICPRHCRVYRSETGGRYWIQDLQSESGTRLNGEPIRRAVLREGDRIAVGGTELVFHVVHPDEPPVSVA